MNYEHIKGWSSMNDQGALLKEIINLMGGKERILMAEVGVYLGRGTAIFDEVFSERNIDYELMAIDNWEGSIEHKTQNIVPGYQQALENLSPISDKVKLIKADSTESANMFDDESFDIVYIDASHEYEPVMADITAWMPKVKNGGFICGDDYAPDWNGVILAVNEYFQGKASVLGSTRQWYFKKGS
jgi:predicted O-methyltransferase YrrM